VKSKAKQSKAEAKAKAKADPKQAKSNQPRVAGTIPADA
jgi:hypothetical protein